MTELQPYNSIKYILFAGLATLIINLVISFYQEHMRIKFEKVQFESTLIVNSIDREDIEMTKKNIKFLIESGLISQKNEKIISLLTDSTFSIVLPRYDTVYITPKNPSEIRNDFLKRVYSAQVIDENNKPIEGVEVKSKTKTKFTNDSSYYAKTFTDNNGLFKLPLPDEKQFIISIKKEGYISSGGRIYSKNVILPNKIKLYKETDKSIINYFRTF